MDPATCRPDWSRCASSSGPKTPLRPHRAAAASPAPRRWPEIPYREPSIPYAPTLLRIHAGDHARRLADVLESRGHDASEKLKRLQAWCAEAEATGVLALQDYSARLKGYALSPA